jgi:hypothetical protein
MLVARTIHRGGYEGLHSAWESFENWLNDNLQTASKAFPTLESDSASVTGTWSEASDIWEWYRVGPQMSENSSDWETDLIRPIHRSFQ